ncbi:hypothetical protein FNZ23_19620, partial [Streptomyces benahoarensis]
RPAGVAAAPETVPAVLRPGRGSGPAGHRRAPGSAPGGAGPPPDDGRGAALPAGPPGPVRSGGPRTHRGHRLRPTRRTALPPLHVPTARAVDEGPLCAWRLNK